jgi:hypothetical protein
MVQAIDGGAGMTRTCAIAVALALILSLSAGRAGAQPTQPPAPAAKGDTQPPPPPEGPAISAGQIQRWFEAFTVLQAQDALQLSEAQYGRFVTRLKALQDTRRRHQQARNQLLGDLRRLTNPQNAQPEDAAMAERLKALRDEEERTAADLRKAYDAVDETLDVQQQARFRLFEDRMEQQKLELLMRARQNARAAARGRKQ